MGPKLSSLFKNQEMRILMAGLDNAGKSTVLAKMTNKSEEVQTTVGFNVDKVKVDKITFNVWDVGGQDAARPLWRHYFDGTRALVYVFDSSDRARLHLSLNELKNMLQAEQLSRCPLLIFLNKQDCPDAFVKDEFKEIVSQELDAELRNRSYWIQPCTASKNEGLLEGFKLLANDRKKRKK